MEQSALGRKCFVFIYGARQLRGQKKWQAFMSKAELNTQMDAHELFADN